MHLTIDEIESMMHQEYFLMILRELTILKIWKHSTSREDIRNEFRKKDKTYIAGKYLEKQ